MYDIAVIGAGPAGTTFARLVADTYKVLLVDKRQPAESRGARSLGKCCGGLLAPDAQGMLSRMGLGLPKSVLVDPQLFVVRTIDAQRNIERYYQRHYINMDRRRFDDWLLSLVPAGVDVQLGRRFRSYEAEKGGFRLTFSGKDGTCTARARTLVGADGATSMVRKTALPRRPLPKLYIALQESVEVKNRLPYFSTLFDPEITDYYCWTIPKEDHLLVGAALHPGRDARAKFERFKDRLRAYGVRLGKTIRREGGVILRPSRMSHLATGTKGIALLGEAAAWISPSSAEGFSYAFKSAAILADVLREGPEHFERRFHRKTNTLRVNILMKNVKAHFIYDPWLRNIVMRTGIQSMKVERIEDGR